MACWYVLKLALVVSIIAMMFILWPFAEKTFNKGKSKPQSFSMKMLNVSTPNAMEYFYYKDTPTSEDNMNQATIGGGLCIPEENTEKNDNKLTVVTNYIPVDTLRDKHSIYGDKKASHEEEMARKFEITTTYQENLNHPYVKTMHIFVQHRSSMDYLRKLDLKNSQKLVIHWINQTVTVKYKLTYISSCLQGHIVAIIHQDNRLGKGFEKLERKLLASSKLMYALTRQPSLSKQNCFHVSATAHCQRGYIGSHDAFIFHVKDLPIETLDMLDTVEGNEAGMENIFVWFFQNKLHFKLTNPCKILHVHHEHCVPIRKSFRRRVNHQFSSGVGFTDQLS